MQEIHLSHYTHDRTEDGAKDRMARLCVINGGSHPRLVAEHTQILMAAHAALPESE